MRQQGGVKAYGPYPHRRKWRVVFRERGEKDLVEDYDTEEQARAVIDAFRSAAQGKTVSQAVDDFLAYQRSIPLAKNSILATRGALRCMLGSAIAAMMVSELSPLRARAMYEAMRARTKSVATQHGALERSKAWGAWLASKGWTRGNPFHGIKPIGRKKKGKVQLRITEARALVDYCVTRGDRAAAAVLCYYLLGVAQGELRIVTGRDIDEGGTLLWIERGKTEKRRRHLEVPPILAPILKRLADEAGPAGLVFPGSKEWSRQITDKITKAAGVTRVTPHGLRGSHSTHAVRGGASSALVMSALDEAARSMGHASTAVTKAHYVAPGATDAATAQNVLRVLAGGRSG